MSAFAMFATSPEDYTEEDILEALSRPRPERWPRCYFCGYCVGPDEEREDHHPAKTEFPDWVEPAHADCHTRYHSRNGHFKHWGGRSSTSGRLGYELALARWPTFHRMGGLARAKRGERNALGQFTKSTN